MNNKLALFLISSIFQCLNATAQQEIESLKSSLKLQTTEAARMHVKLEIGDRFQPIDKDSALFWYSSIAPAQIHDSIFYTNWFSSAEDAQKYYVTVGLARSGLLLVQKASNEFGIRNISKAYNMAMAIGQPQLALYCSDNLAVEFAKQKQFEPSVIWFEKSLAIYQQLNDGNGITFCLGNLGAINANLGQYSKAVDYFEQLLAIQQLTSNPTETLNDIINIAALYLKLEDFEKSRTFWEKALDASSGSHGGQQLATIVSNLGTVNFKLNELEASSQYFNKLLEMAVATGSKRDELLALQNLAAISYNKEDFSNSLEYWNRALQVATALGNGPAVLDALLNLSNINNQINNLDVAAQFFEKYIAVGKQLGDTKTMAQSYVSIGEIQERTGNYDKAREYFGQAIKIYEENSDTNGLALANNYIGKTYFKQQQYQNALDFYNANLSLGVALGERNIANALQGKADVLRSQLQYPQALEYYQKALELREKLNDVNQATACLNSLGFIFEITGNIPKSVASYEKALQLALSTGNKEGISAIYNNIGIVYRKLGDFPKALESYEKALAIYLESDNQEEASYCYNNMGIIYENQGDFSKANEYYEKSLTIKEGSQDKQGLATSLMNMGNVYKHLKNYGKAEESYNKSLALSQDIGDRQGMALALGSIASLGIETNDFDKTIDFATRSLAIAQEIDMQNAIKEAYKQKAYAYNATNVPEWAEEAYMSLLEMNYADINRNFSILSESEKELYYKTLALDFDRFHSFALKRQQTNPTITKGVYNNIIKNKGLLLKSGTSMRNAILSSNDRKLIETFEQWIALRQNIAKLYTMPIEERKVNPADLEKQANNLERTLVRSSSDFSNFEKSMKISWIDIRDKLQPGEAAIEFTHFVHSRDSVLYCAMVVLPQMEAPKMVMLFEERQLARLLGTFGGNNLQYITQIYGKKGQENVTLYNLIWKPLEPLLKDVKTIYYSPSGLLHKLSLSAIEKGGNNLLVDSYDLHLLSSTGLVVSAGKINLGAETAVSLFGGIAYTTEPSATETWTYLKGTLDEAIMLDGILRKELDHVTTLTDSMATEARFRLLAQQSDILHIATHGFFFPDPKDVQIATEAAKEFGEIEFRGGTRTHGLNNFVRNQNPLMRSGLVFAGVNDYWNGAKQVTGDDGVLTALEVINVDMRKTQLVVMSACETGLGEIAGSEGVYGLQRAFKMAGTGFLVMSLWQVPDKETAEFMGLFYTQLLATKDLQRAFSNTQKEMRAKYDPYFWAAFVLME
jgi:tetratricopeptide (TPR) repeat protein/CHAT domain-containing protein